MLERKGKKTTICFQSLYKTCNPLFEITVFCSFLVSLHFPFVFFLLFRFGWICKWYKVQESSEYSTHTCALVSYLPTYSGWVGGDLKDIMCVVHIHRGKNKLKHKISCVHADKRRVSTHWTQREKNGISFSYIVRPFFFSTGIVCSVVKNVSFISSSSVCLLKKSPLTFR